jgi:cytidine deaminase
VSTPIDWAPLESTARAVRENAHAPYSRYQVGAALVTKSGKTFAGCNVENASYGLSLCAERSAILQMVAAGEREPVALVVVTEGPVVGTPCGACRQVLAEFATELPIRLSVATEGVPSRDTSLETLLPDAFRADALGR